MIWAAATVAAMSLFASPMAFADTPANDSPSAKNTKATGNSRIQIKLTGERLDKKAKVAIKGISGSARGYQKTVSVSRLKTVRRLPSGTYKLKAKLIQASSHPNTNPLFAPFGRTSAAKQPVQKLQVTRGSSQRVTFDYPRPPKFPKDFRGKGRFIVRDLGFDVPFKWKARNGEIQMIAGGWNHPIFFTNLIKDHILYTKTYKWPGVGPGACLNAGPWDRKFFNDWFQTARYVGPVILQGDEPREVNHFRAGIVLGITPAPGNYPRSPVAEADIFVDQDNSMVFRNVQHFGLQNLLDPQLDEWIQMDTFVLKPGRIDPPDDCTP